MFNFWDGKNSGLYGQFEPKLYTDGTQIPPVKLGDSFKCMYLGKLFAFNKDDLEIKSLLKSKVKTILDKITNLKISSQTKLKIVRLYIHSQLNFELRLYNLSKNMDTEWTWFSYH